MSYARRTFLNFCCESRVCANVSAHERKGNRLEANNEGKGVSERAHRTMRLKLHANTIPTTYVIAKYYYRAHGIFRCVSVDRNNQSLSLSRERTTLCKFCSLTVTCYTLTTNMFRAVFLSGIDV